MKKIFLNLNVIFFTLNFYAQKSEKISVTNERKYTINGESIIEKDTINIPKSNLLKENSDKTKTYFVIYDFKKGEYIEGLIKPRVDLPVVYKIINVNRLAFDVKVNAKDEVVAETDWFTSSEDLKKITGLISESKPSSQIEVSGSAVSSPKIATGNKSKETERNILNIKKLDSLNNEKSIIALRIEEYKNLKHKKVNFKNLYNDTLYIEKNKIIDYDFKKDSTNLRILQNEINKIVILKNDKLNEFQNAKEEFKKTYEEFVKSYDQIDMIIQASNKVMPIANQSFLSKAEYVIKYQDDFRSTFIDLMAIDISINFINNQYTNLVVANNKINNIDGLEDYFDKSSLKKYFSEIDSAFDNAKKIKFKEELIDFEKLSNQVKRIINLLEKEETYEYISSPVQPKNDLATFEVEITAKNKDVEVNNSRKFKHSEFVRRGTRIDFSMGLAGSYYSNAKVYEIYTVNGQNKVGLKSENLTVPSIIAMMSMTSRSSKYLAIGGSAGLGIDINNGKIQIGNFFIGPTLILGKYDRLMFTPGVALRNVGKLKNGFKLDDTILEQTSDINSVLTDNYKLGFFVALTYNLTKNVRDKISNYK